MAVVTRRGRTVAERQQRIRESAYEDTHATGGRRSLTGRQAASGAVRGTGRAARGTVRTAGRVTGAGDQLRRRYTARHMLTAELLAGVGITAIRAVADYEPRRDGTLKGKIGHPSGQYGPLPVLAGLIITFFLLSFLAASGGTKARVAVIAGGLVDLVLAMKSLDEFTTVSSTFSSFGTAQVPAGDWQTSGAQADSAFGDSSSSPSSSSSSPGSGGQLPPAVSM